MEEDCQEEEDEELESSSSSNGTNCVIVALILACRVAGTLYRTTWVPPCSSGQGVGVNLLARRTVELIPAVCGLKSVGAAGVRLKW